MYKKSSIIPQLCINVTVGIKIFPMMNIKIIWITSATLAIIFTKHGPNAINKQGKVDISNPNIAAIQIMLTKVKKPQTFWKIDV